jgi:bacterial/archaeal transporter family protein
MWVTLALLSAVFLGLYDIAKKRAVHQNAVLPTVAFATTCSFVFVCLFWVLQFTYFPKLFPPLALSRVINPYLYPQWPIVIKALIIGTAWTLNYFSLKHLPISIVAPIRSSGPFFTLLGAIMIFKESLTPYQWMGLGTVLVSYWFLNKAGKIDGIQLKNNKWLAFILISTVGAAISGLIDKALLQNVQIPPWYLQFWFMLYLTLFLWASVFLFWYPSRKSHTPFKWNYNILLIGLFLALADILYFWALSNPEALISITSGIRRSCVLVSFVIGSLLFKEKNRRKKGFAMLGILAGVLMILLT